MNRWSIIQFLEDGTVEAVPSVWVVDGYCHWPSLPHGRLTNAIKKCEPVNDSWEKHKIKLFSNGTFDDYARARAKAITAEDTSDLQSEIEGRKRNRNEEREQLLLSSDDEESESTLPSPPILKKKGKFVTCTNENDEQNAAVSKNSVIIENQDTATRAETSPNGSTIQTYLKPLIEQLHLQRTLLCDILTRVEAIENHLKQKPTKDQDIKSIFKLK